MKYIKMALLAIFMILLTACGSSSNTTTLDQEAAIQTIMNYAETGTPEPTVQDYIDAGVTGVTKENLTEVNNAVSNLAREDVDTVEEIQAIVIELGIQLADTEAPVISINGTDPMNLLVGSTYTEPGATCTDNYDPSCSVTIGGDTVDTSTAGSYTVTYDAVDTAGNIATQKTRTVNVADTVAPVISINGTDPMNLLVGSTYTESGATCTDNYDPSCSVTIGGDTVDTSTVGTYTVTYNAVDTSGNIATQKTRTVNVADTVAPVISINGTDPMNLLVGSTYTEPGATCTDNYDPSCSVTIGGDTVDTSTAGSYTVTYDAVDTAGNIATQKTRTVNVADTVAPVISINGTDPMNLLVGSTYTEPGATCTDNYDPSCSVTIGGDTVDTSASGSYVVTYDAIDTSGNTATQKTRTVNVIASLIFIDNFDTDTLSTYTLSIPPSADTWREQLRNIFLNVPSGEITLSKTLDATVQQGHFSLQFKPTIAVGYNAQIRINLKQDADNYYHIILGNGNGKNLYIAKTINGAIDTDTINDTVYYKANTNNKIDITFGPRGATVTALGTTATINTGNTPLDISSFEIYAYKNKAYIDNISLNAQSAKNIQIMTPHPGHIQTGDTIEVNATADTGKTVTFTLNGVTQTASETSGVYSSSFIVPKGDYSIDANISGQTGFNNVDHIDHIGRGDIYVALGDSITNGDYDDDLSDDISADGRVKNMGFEAKLSDTLSMNNSYPVVVLNEGIGGEQSLGGAARLTDVITSHPEANTYLIIYGTNDASDFAVDNNHSRPSGLGLVSTDGNYTDTFKDHMQQIINTLDTNGKTPVIAKILPVLGAGSSSVVSSDIEGLERNVNIREYNQVIDELSIENAGVVTLGPDLYNDFNTTFVPNFTAGDGAAEFLIKDGYANALHPDGVGYSSMADWWFGAL